MSCAIALAACPHPTGQAVIVALLRAQRPVWAPGVRILGSTAHYSQAIAHFVDRADSRERSRSRTSPGIASEIIGAHEAAREARR